MKLIDQTPLQDENGQISFIQRVQGTLKYGFDWYPELQAQNTVLAHLSRVLGKGFTVIRNQTLGASGITIPLTIVGPSGIYMAHVTHLQGTYQARREEWGQLFGVNFRPARVNLITRTQLFARALQAFIERQGIKLPKPVEPVILAADAAFHVESMQPAVRFILVDALERWGASLETAAPVFTLETAYELADRIVNPRPPKQEESVEDVEQAPEVSKEEAFDTSEIGFAFEEVESAEDSQESIETNPPVPIPSRAGAGKRFLGMTTRQLVLLGGMFLVEICLLVGLVLLIFLNS